MPKRTRKYEESLTEALKDPVEAAAYLNACLEDDGEGDAEELFLVALRDVAKAHGFTEVASKSKIGRESLYKVLSEEGNPTLATLSALLHAMGLRISVEAEQGRKSA